MGSGTINRGNADGASVKRIRVGEVNKDLNHHGEYYGESRNIN